MNYHKSNQELSRKQIFNKDFNDASVHSLSHIIVVVQLPSGAREVIVNSQQLEEKFFYYLETYDDSLKMYKNQEIRLVDWLIV